MEKAKNSILIVDDIESNIVMLTDILSPDYPLITATNGREGIALAEKHMPDIILLDILMNEMDGYEVLKTLKESEKTKNIPVIFVTSLDNAEEEEKGLSLGAADYITKPFSPPVVKLRIENQISILENLKTVELQLTKLNLMTKATKIALWDMEIVNSDPINPKNVFKWTVEFRNMLGFKDETDFPNILSSWSDRLHPDDKEATLEAFKNHMLDTTGNVPYDVEYRLLKKNGEYAYYHASGETIRDENGTPIRVVGSLMDITETKNALLNHEMQLTRLKLITEVTKVGMWDMDIIEGNPSDPDIPFVFSDTYRSILGFTDETDFPNVFGSWVDRVHPEDLDRALDSFNKHIEDKTGYTPYDIELRMMTKQGEYRYFRDWGDTIRDEDGNPVCVVGSVMDITDTKNMLLNLEEHRREAEAANRAKSTFLSTVSHEIRTPLNAIIGITEIELNKKMFDASTTEALNRIHAAGDMLLGIINDLLDTSKAESGKLELVCDDYDVASLLSDVAQLNVMRIGSKPIEFELDADENLPMVLWGDQLRVKQILNNILSNAFKYTDEGAVKLSASAEYDDGDNENNVTLVFTVSDTGQGMTEEQLEKLFDRYTRFNLEVNRAIEGTGLGMNITRALVQIMKGEITTESVFGKGSTFHVRIPQSKSKNNQSVLGKEITANLRNFRANENTRMKRVQITREPMPYGSVLIVDDVDTNIYVASGLLTPYKLKIDSAESGFAAVEKIKEGKVYDIIFMDHMMPLMDGIETTKMIRGLGYNHPIVALSANAITGQADIFLENGFDDFISKPIDVRQMNTILNKLIRDKQPPEVLKTAAKHTNGEDNTENNIILLAGKEIDGLNIKKGLEKYNNNETVYIKILRAFASGNRAIIKSLEGKEPIGESDLQEYRISVHSTNGTAFSIFADELGETAKKLETAAVAGDLDYINQNHSAFLEKADKLISAIEALLEETDKSNPKPAKNKPDAETLQKLSDACKMFSMSGVDEAMAEIDKYNYTDDGGLTEWLRGKVKIMRFSEIADKLKEVL